ncbi:pilus assembly FimT family protein [Thermovibrio sp.]
MVRKVKGFTILEFIVVISVLLFFLLLAVPPFLKWKKRVDIEKDTDIIYSTIQRYRMKALLSHTPYELYLAPNGKELLITQNDKLIVEYKLSSPFKFNGSTTRVRINEKGIINQFTVYSNSTDLDSLNPTYSCVVSSGGVRLKRGKWNGKSCQ